MTRRNVTVALLAAVAGTGIALAMVLVGARNGDRIGAVMTTIAGIAGAVAGLSIAVLALTTGRPR